MKTLEPIWHEKTETANRVRSRIEAVLDWAAARGYRSGENPARWRGHIENLLPRRSKVQPIIHYAALPYREMGVFVAELRQRDGIAARALEFLILTASRTSEVLGARWDEIDMAARLWTIPGKRMKSGREHRVPLSPAAMVIVEKMAAIRSSEYIFPGRNGALGPVTLRRALAATGRHDLTTHGFRSSFRDWCAELTQFPHEVAEMALAHAVGNEVERAYRRGDLFEKRRQLAEAWARFCEAPGGHWRRSGSDASPLTTNVKWGNAYLKPRFR
jgi:integrase